MLPRIPSSPPLIAPVATGVERPEWSVMIPAYNCSKYLPDALESVLMQGFSEEDMQIEVVDDASTDADVEEIVNRIGKGRIKYFRQPQNVGSLRNFETCINRSRGQIIHLLHGDDCVKMGFYEKIGKLLTQYSDAGAAFCRYHYINEEGEEAHIHHYEMNCDGILTNWLQRIAEANSIQYVAIAVKREVYEKLGAFYGITYGEDWEMWVRVAKYYSVAYTPEALANYRLHNTSITGVKSLNGGIFKDALCVFDMIKRYLPAQQYKSIIKKAKRNFALYGVQNTEIIWYKTYSIKYVNANVFEILKMCNSDIIIYKQLLKLYKSIFIGELRQINAILKSKF